MTILTLNCWNHSIKYSLFSGRNRVLQASGRVERIGIGDSFITHRTTGREEFAHEAECGDHRSAIELILDFLGDPQRGVGIAATAIDGVGHRVAHGGEKFRNSALVDGEVVAAIGKLRELAPLHNGANLAGIEAAMALLPGVPQVAIFDTAFHQSMPEHAYLYPLPYEWYSRYGIRRYGFHGASHLYLLHRGAALLGKPAEACNLVTIHIDRGVSLCAIRNGVSIDTSMGLTPLEGAVMDTRCGDIDPGITSFMMQEKNLSAREMEKVLGEKSGISGLTGRPADRRHLLQAAIDGDDRCRTALKVEGYRLKKYIGSYAAAAGPLDAIVFTAGSGDLEWLAREIALDGLDCLGIRLCVDSNRSLPVATEGVVSAVESSVRVLVVPTDEELVFAEEVAALLPREETGTGRYCFAAPGFTPRSGR